MPSPAIYSKTQLKLKIGATYVPVEGVTTLGGPNFSKPPIEITTMESTAKEFKAAALADPGVLNFTLQYAPSNATHSYIVSQSANNVAGNDLFLMKFSDATVFGFTGSMTSFAITAADPSQGILEAAVDIQITGNVSFSGSFG
jgi:hypothetical protein